MQEADIRPEHLFQRYLELSAEDATHCFSGAVRSEMPCVACGCGTLRAEFVKHGFQYVSCVDCGTLFQNPRPAREAFESFYSGSRSSEYWATVFFPAVAEARREHIFRKRVAQLSELCAKRSIDVRTVIDVGAGYGIFLEEWRTKHPDCRLIAVEPSRTLADICRGRGLEVIEAVAEKAAGCDDAGDVVACFEVLEHVHQPLEFVNVLARFVKPGGYLLVSTLGVDGFDIQVLWEKSNSISPPHHINFMSVAGFRHLFVRAGLTDIDVLTPGVLDVDIVRNALRKDSAVLSGHRFLQHLMANRSAADAFQDFLMENCLSSHTWVLARRPFQQ